MITNNIPKSNKQSNKSLPKRIQSQDLLNKTTKRKTAHKKIIEVQSRSSLMRSPNHNKNIKQNKSKKDNTKQSKQIKKKKVGKDKPSLQKKQKDCVENFDKTLKKFRKKKIQTEQKQLELTERKKFHLEYFMYKDVCVPVQNTQQKKIIFKIKLIDQNVQKLPSPLMQHETRVMTHTNLPAPTKKAQLVDKGIQPTDRKYKNIDFQCQTQTQTTTQIRLSQSSSQPQKCLAQTLSQLQFLYLPDQKNFTGLSKSQKAHYRQLLLYMAKKFEQPQKAILDEQQVCLLLNQRYLKQRGELQSYPKNGIPTHTPSILSYVANLFCYIQLNQKNYLIERLNCSYGYCMAQKLQKVLQQKNIKINTPLISENIFWKFQQQLHQGLKFQSQTIEQALNAHNKAIFDAVNQILIQFQPYYNSQGQPFPWSYNFQTTFFCISQQSFQALISQIKDKLYSYSTTLAGIYLDIQSQYRYKIHINKILTTQHVMLKQQLNTQNDKIEIQNNKTVLLCDIANLIELELIKQLAKQVFI